MAIDGKRWEVEEKEEEEGESQKVGMCLEYLILGEMIDDYSEAPTKAVLCTNAGLVVGRGGGAWHSNAYDDTFQPSLHPSHVVSCKSRPAAQ
jgi:hypothetical protein